MSNDNKLDFSEIYRQAITERKNISSAILGLSETGEPEDINIISKFNSDNNANVRFATLIASYTLNQNIGIKNAYNVLENDTSIKVKKAGEQIFMKEGFDIKRLREIYDLVESDAKGIFLRLYNKFGGWSIAGDYLKAMSENDEGLKQKAEIYLNAWINYTIRLGTQQTNEDKKYVLQWYNEAKRTNKNTPKSIPFIFGDKTIITELK